MPTFRNRSFTHLLLAGLYALGILGIVASGSSGGGSDDDDFACTLETGAIAATTDGSADIWAGLLADTTAGRYQVVLRLDNSGKALVSYSLAQGAQQSLVRTLAIATDALNLDDVYVGGDFERGILRLNDDGSLDSGFATGVGFNGPVNSIVAADDGSGDIYVGGNFTEYDGKAVSGLVRLKSSGLLDDIGFAPAPVANVEGVALASFALLPGFVYSGSSTLPNAAALWRPNGVQDPDFTPAVAQVFAVASLADGNLYVGGNSATGVLRLTIPDGNNDGGFDGSGFDARIQTIVLAGDMTGDIYVGGGFSNYKGLSANGIIRLADDGSRRAGFDIGDGFTYDADDPASTGLVQAIARAEDGTTDLYAGGRFAYYDGSRSNGIARLNADGSLDKDFDVKITVEGDSCTDTTPADPD